MTVLTLASGSAIRATLLRNAGLQIAVQPARIDEEMLRESLQAEGAGAHDLADALAEHKALKVARRNPQGMVLGCDQILECDGRIFAKPRDKDEARAQLDALRGKTHRLHTAAVLFAQGEPVWRHVATPRLTMRDVSDSYRDAYIERNWDEIRHCVGAYQIEAEGVRLFSAIEGDLFSIQGLPLLELLQILTRRKDIDG
ncbi:Maf family protein [Rhodobacter sp. NTK016B]|uniref:Maf family protein n=1 Tax=Rhodobacter sp. NTK016B TaxID=2759676 RepID=UPI001A8D1F24|nr:Maf family protein [Rhodobacter sp. NTK016B]MBN8292226.1 Maf family protein [Rhodobacter sp. NTK016B]